MRVSILAKQAIRKNSVGLGLFSRLLILFLLLFVPGSVGAKEPCEPPAMPKLNRELGDHVEPLRKVSMQEKDLSRCDSNPESYARALCRAATFTDQGKLSEAIAELTTEKARTQYRTELDALQPRIDTLERWKERGYPTLEDFRSFYARQAYDQFPARAYPIVAVWDGQGYSGREKFVLLADLLQKRGDLSGRALALSIAAELSDQESAETPRLLLAAGNAFYESGDKSRAEVEWKKVATFPKTVPDWPKAVYNLGILERDRKNYRQAIQYFRQVIDSHPNDKEPGSNIMEIYRNYSHWCALDISICYERMGNYSAALKYTLAAKNRYPYHSWCGTCLQSENWEINKRIAYLLARQSPFHIALAALLLASSLLVL